MEDCAMEEEEIDGEKTLFCRYQYGGIQDDIGRCVICTHVCVCRHATYMLAHMPGNA